MKRLIGLSALALSMTLGACGGTTSNSFQKPANSVAINFSADDHLNKNWKAGELLWKGSFLVDPTTRVLIYDSWTGKFPDGSPGWPTLYDDGPWTAGGHEPDGAIAGDNIWGYTAFVDTTAAAAASWPPAGGGLPANTFSYGLLDANQEWVWSCSTAACASNGGNASFTMAIGQTTDLTPTGMTFSKAGSTDLKLVLDSTALDPVNTWDPTAKVTVKGSAWGWNEQNIFSTKDSSGKFSFVLSNFVGPGKAVDTGKMPYPSLLTTGQKPEFVFVVGGVEYKNGKYASPAGVTAFTELAGSSSFVTAPVKIYCQTTTSTPAIVASDCDGTNGNGNTYVVAP
jgi:hypothetical protein